MTLTKRFLIAGCVAAGIGVLVAAGFLVASGLDYRAAEDAGIEPGYTAEWILSGMKIGFLLIGLGALAAIAGGALALRRMTLMKRFLIAGCLVAGTGVLVVAGFFVAIGFDDSAEDAGVEPGYAAEWILNGMNIGFLLIGLGALVAIAGGTLALRRTIRPAD